MVSMNHLNRGQLLQIIQDELSLDESREYSAHLDHCLLCQRELETHAADPTWWKETQSFLSTSELQRPDFANTQIRGEKTTGTPAAKGVSEKNINRDEIRRDELESEREEEATQVFGRLNHYEIHDVIGQGGFGIVYKAKDTELQRWVAIKMLAPHLASNGAARQRFAREAQAAAAIIHPNVVPIYSVHSEHTPPYLVMQYVPGNTLEQRIQSEGPLSLETAIRISLQLADGLAAAHSQGLIHRDIKPANVLLEIKGDRAYLTDFGLARAGDDVSMTHSGFLVGTPQYMSPEQVNGNTIDARSDLFSLGSILYCMLTGRVPFRGETPIAILRKVADSAHRPVREVNRSLPAWVDRLIDLLLAKEPHQRIQTAEELSQTLRVTLQHLQNPDFNPLPAKLKRDESNRVWQGKRLVITGGIVMGTFAIGLALGQMFIPSNTNETKPRGEGDKSELTKPFAGPAITSLPESSAQTKVESKSSVAVPMTWEFDRTEISRIDAELDRIHAEMQMPRPDKN